MSLLQEMERHGLADCEFNRKLTQRYVIHDNECGNFCEWSFDNPPSEIEIRYHFKRISDDEGLGDDEPVPLEHFSLEMIQDIWNVRIQSLEEYQLEEGNHDLQKS